jgi:hypothetical protein
MPADVGLWIVAVIAAAVVVALALWLGRDVALKFKWFSFSADRPKPVPSTDVRVAEQAEVHGNVGRVVGRSVSEGEATAGATEVGKRLKVDGSVDEIVGVETTRRPPSQ